MIFLLRLSCMKKPFGPNGTVPVPTALTLWHELQGKQHGPAMGLLPLCRKHA